MSQRSAIQLKLYEQSFLSEDSRDINPLLQNSWRRFRDTSVSLQLRANFAHARLVFSETFFYLGIQASSIKISAIENDN